eukprot:831905-Rhodomonas_salina.1
MELMPEIATLGDEIQWTEGEIGHSCDFRPAVPTRVCIPHYPMLTHGRRDATRGTLSAGNNEFATCVSVLEHGPHLFHSENAAQTRRWQRVAPLCQHGRNFNYNCRQPSSPKGVSGRY